MCQSENALSFWKETIIIYSQRFGEPFISDISTNLMDIIKNKNNEAYQNNCAELLIELLNKIPTTKKEVEYGTPEMANEIKRLFSEGTVNTKKIIANVSWQEKGRNHQVELTTYLTNWK